MNGKSKLALLVIFIVFTLFSHIGMAWWDTNWQYRIPVTITETSGSSLTDYQVKITLDTASLISAGKMNNDCSDIRVVDSDDITALSFWIEDGTCNSTSTVIWAKVPSLTASSSKTIYVYYGVIRTFNIQNNEASDLTDFQVSLPISGIDNTAKLVINRAGQTETLPWWSDGDYVWVKVPLIPASGSVTLEVKADTTNGVTGNGNNVFILFDNFDDGILAGTAIDGTWTESGGILSQTLDTTTGLDNSYDMGALTVTDNIIFEAKAKTDAINAGWFGIALASGSTTYVDGVLDIYNNWARIMDISSDAIVTDVSSPITTDETAYHIIKLTRTGTTYTVEIEGVTATLTSSLVPTNAYLQSRRASDYFDYAYVRKYTANEPTITETTSITSTSDITNTFIFGDDFNDGTLDTTKWVSQGSVVENAGTITVTDTGATDGAYSSITFSPNIIAEGKISISGNTLMHIAFDDNWGGLIQNDYIQTWSGGTGIVYFATKNSGTASAAYEITKKPGYSKIKLVWTTSSAEIYEDGTLLASITDTTVIPTMALPLRFNEWNNDWSSFSIDWIFARKYASSEPTTSVGTEETNTANLPPTITINSPKEGQIFEWPYLESSTIYIPTNITTSDPEGDNYTCKILKDGYDSGLSWDQTNPEFNQSLYFTWIDPPMANNRGNRTITVECTDSNGANSSKTVTFRTLQKVKIKVIRPDGTPAGKFNLSVMEYYRTLNGFGFCSYSWKNLGEFENETSIYVEDYSLCWDTLNENIYPPKQKYKIEIAGKDIEPTEYEKTWRTSTNGPPYAKSENITFMVWNVADIKLFDNKTSSYVNTFELTVTNGSITKQWNTTDGHVIVSLKEFPLGNVNLTFSSFGYQTTSYLEEITNTTEINKTYTTNKAGLYVKFMDEKSTNQITVNATIFNSTASVQFSNVTTLDENWSIIPLGNVTLIYSAVDRPTRELHFYINEHIYRALNAYSLENNDGKWTQFYVLKPSGVIIPGAMMTFQRAIKGKLETIAQKVTDSTGQATFFLDSTMNYKLYITSPQVNAEFDIVPVNNQIILYAYDNYSRYSSLFDDLSIDTNPKENYVSRALECWNMTLISGGNKLIEYGINVVAQDGETNSTNDTQPFGSTLTVCLNLSNSSSQYVQASFWWNHTDTGYGKIEKKYWIYSWNSYGNSTIDSVIDYIKQNAGFGMAIAYMVLTILAIGVLSTFIQNNIVSMMLFVVFTLFGAYLGIYPFWLAVVFSVIVIATLIGWS